MVARIVVLFALVAVLCGVSDAISTCRSKSALPSSKCTHLQQTGLTADEKRKVLNLHNELRQKVARGQEQRGNPGPQPAATNMPQLTWDDELEEMAQQWANQCDLENHDSCIPKGVGQNMASRGTTGNVNSIDVKYLVKDWYNEVDLFNSNEVASFVFHKNPKKIIGHYTQMVWAKTTKIGCGAIKFKEREFNTFSLVCNYRVAGNCPGEPVYQRR